VIIRERERNALKAFYAKMNEKAKNLGLREKVTKFSVSHGMHHDFNYSSARDIATISWNVMRMHPLFCTVVDTKIYECQSII
jgi:D-alanyl-D-alanine carboxypeptidase